MDIGVVGVGKLGLCFALNLAERGHRVVGCDVRRDYADSLQRREFVSDEPMVDSMLAASPVSFTHRVEDVVGCDVVFIFVNTPSLPDGSFDHAMVSDAHSSLGAFGGTIVISSTVMPGYCDSLRDERVVYNPQFIAQGSIVRDQRSPDLVLIGAYSGRRGDLVRGLYEGLCEGQPRYRMTSPLGAEVAKLALNCYVTMKISFANMVGDICRHIGADCDEVLEAVASDSRVGPKSFRYGYGYGGPCFPRDNRAFSVFASRYVQPHLNVAAEESNEGHLATQLRLIEAGSYPGNLDREGDTFVIRGVCFKQGSRMTEASQQLRLALELAKRYKVRVVEDPVVIRRLRSEHGDVFEYEEVS